ncbi:unnamed protein product [Brassica napus]|uniref:Meiosis-specific protein ASY3-like coiled-coil domain-containing protein n=2 Tax=Brassica TaxID=3705 RepID=M4C8A9_BRACM|nr:unnamed protein product [Brassica napus]VDC80577.1 unnamed protein product [Brassica rapa]
MPEMCSMDYLKMAMNSKGRGFLELEKKGEYSLQRESSGEPTEDLVLSDPSSDEEGSNGSPALGHCISPEERETTNWCNEQSKPGFSSAKRNSNLKDNGRVVLSPTSSLSKGLLHCFLWLFKTSRKKLKSAARKKSSEIIASVSEEIHLELENVKSHIITEAYVFSIDYALLFFSIQSIILLIYYREKTSNVPKTKRQHAETRLQEQQEKMRMIHEM